MSLGHRSPGASVSPVTPSAQRVVGVVVLLVTGDAQPPGGGVSSTARARRTGSSRCSCWRWPRSVPRLAVALPGPGPRGRADRTPGDDGSWWGLLAALVGVLVFWFLLNGFSGA